MATLTIELPQQEAQTAFNVRRWDELLADPELNKVEGRIETEEALSPSNTRAEIEEKTALYFDAGAQEVWLCAADGVMSFRTRGATAGTSRSLLCPNFPTHIELRQD